MAVVTLALLIGAQMVAVGIPARAAAQEPPTRASFSWAIDDSFGSDADGDGVIEIENTPEYVHNRLPGSCSEACPEARFWVELVATPQPSQIGLPSPGLVSYEWHVSGGAGTGVYHRSRPDLRLRLPEGRHEIDLRVAVELPWGQITLRTRGEILVDDILVVAIGDSYASGEGSPDRPIDGETEPQWADASGDAEAAAHAVAHRSTVGWPARTALALEDSSQQSSVTFVDLAVSGARIDRGLLQGRTDPPIPAQLDDVEGIVQGRQIDILLLQIGGNDVGFSRVIRALVEADPLLNPVCYEILFDNVWASADDGIWDRDTRVTYDPPFDIGCEAVDGTRSVIPGFDGLVPAFARLDQRIDTLGVAAVYVMEYPDPTGGTTGGAVCDEIVGDVTPPFGFHEVDEQEQAAGVARLLDPLNRELEAAADRYGWVFIDSVSEGFTSGHGYCADWPNYGYPDQFEKSPLLFRNRLAFPEGWYRPPQRFGSPLLLNDGPTSWYRTASQSSVLQGPTPRYLTPGTLHPNELGHAAMARLALTAIAEAD
jgi:lysophospholipase L1-like esterase